jgi:predicted acylesterase/phospholipase RssA
MQLGVAHALLVIRGEAPEYVAGISAGAINAAALAQILQAGGVTGNGDDKRCAQVDDFRKFLTSFEEVPGELLRSILPDAYEINARRPLPAVELPIHFDAERTGRDSANQSRAGLIRLLNRLFRVSLTVGAFTVIVNRILELVAAAEKRTFLDRLGVTLKNWMLLWLEGYRQVFAIAPTFWYLLQAAIRGSGKQEGSDSSGSRKKAGGKPSRGTRFAGSLIGRFEAVRESLGMIGRLIGVVSFAALWTLSPLCLPFALLLGLRRPAPGTVGIGRRICDRMLEYFAIADGLGDTYVLKEQLIRCFDDHYYGSLNIDHILDKALDKSMDPACAATRHRTLSSYQDATANPRIVVAPIAADVATGELQVLPGDVSVVDALLAANAAVPVFPAVKLESQLLGPHPRYFIDGMTVSNEAIGALIKVLREETSLDGAASVDLYPFSPLAPPIGTHGECTGILQVVARALKLKRFRDATIEQRLTSLYTKALPPGQARTPIAGKCFVNANVWPLEVERPVELNREVLTGGSGVTLKQLIEEAVADGCRAALETMIPGAIAASRAHGAPTVRCRQAVDQRLGSAGLPGNDPAGGPGLPEICNRCAVSRPRTGAAKDVQSLVFHPERSTWPEWPVASAPAPKAAAPAESPAARGFDLPAGWPRSDKHPQTACGRYEKGGARRPLVSLLFGGGVFRGVFHMGVMNALNELGLEPDLVAGSSVGSIIAAMIAQVFAKPKAGRPEEIANLASTFLTIDRLVMTDRLADFVRGLTLRSADANFSPRDVDLMLRRYDSHTRPSFDGLVRRVAAGIERLFYLSPVSLFALVKAARTGDVPAFTAGIQTAVQKFLDRSGVGKEILGTEPLALLIQEEVVRRLDPAAKDLKFATFLEQGIYFLATATNLTRGQLEILGSPGDQADASLRYGLLASSAFPAVFRPRAGWQIFPRATDNYQYIDGGTMDNLPLDAVARFLDQASQYGEIARRPRVDGEERPHLLFTASLEVDKSLLSSPKDVKKLCRSWLRLRERARTFGYNLKIDTYAEVQRDLRHIYRCYQSPHWTPLDLEVLAVRPQWLCSTFGFHPMLGFRRRKQAESIAHGCASTFATFRRFHDQEENGKAVTAAWGLDDDTLAAIDAEATAPVLTPAHQNKRPGQCWFRQADCPFSMEALSADPKLSKRPKATLSEIAKIYAACGKPATHRAV